MYTKRLMRSMVVVVLLGTGSTLKADPITYYLVDYPEDQDGWKLTGFIKTDGTMGDLSVGNILEWEWQASKLSEEITVSSHESDAYVTCTSDGIVADDTRISIFWGSETCNYRLLLGSSDTTHAYLDYCVEDVAPSGMPETPLAYYKCGTQLTTSWDTTQDWEMWNSGRVIAEVPEPGTSVLCFVGALCVGLTYAAGRRRSANIKSISDEALLSH